MSETPAHAARVAPWRTSTVQAILLSTLLAPLGVPLIAPALPVVRDAFALTDAQASLLVSVYFLTGIVLSPFIGVLADRVGRRRVLVPSLLLFGVAGGAIAFAPSYAVVLAVRLVQGTAAAGIFITTVTLIGDAFDGVERNAVLGLNTAVLSAGAAIYPLVGGYLATVSWRAPFLAYLAGIPVALFAYRAIEEPEVVRPAPGLDYLRRVTRSLATSDVLRFYAATFATELLLFGAVLTAMPFLLASEYRLSPVVIGAVITAAEVVATGVSYANGWFAARASNAAIVTGGFACYGVGLVAAWLAPTAVLVAAGIVVATAGFGLVVPSVDAALSGRVDAELRAGALSLRNSVTFLGRAAGPILFAALAVPLGYRVLLLAAGAASLGIVGLSLVAGVIGR